MTLSEQLELQTTLRLGHCQHPNRVNICSECLAKLEKVLMEAKVNG